MVIVSEAASNNSKMTGGGWMITIITTKINKEKMSAQFDMLMEKIPTLRKKYIQKISNEKAKFSALSASLLLHSYIEHQFHMTKADYEICVDENGKPYIPQLPEFHFNITHSGRYVAVACGDVRMGIDLECKGEYRSRIAERCFTETDKKYITDKCEKKDIEHLAQMRAHYFCEVWTIKESYAKYTGNGLAENMKTIEIDYSKQQIKGTKIKYETREKKDYFLTVCAKTLEPLTFAHKSLDKAEDMM